jgi:hypothetical protein
MEREERERHDVKNRRHAVRSLIEGECPIFR